jgi:hypothetical protein
MQTRFIAGAASTLTLALSTLAPAAVGAASPVAPRHTSATLCTGLVPRAAFPTGMHAFKVTPASSLDTGRRYASLWIERADYPWGYAESLAVVVKDAASVGPTYAAFAGQANGSAKTTRLWSFPRIGDESVAITGADGETPGSHLRAVGVVYRAGRTIGIVGIAAATPRITATLHLGLAGATAACR